MAAKETGKAKPKTKAKAKPKKKPEPKASSVKATTPVVLKEEAPAQRGRPSEFCQERAAEFCRLLAEGKTVRAVCRRDDMPSTATFYRWLEGNPDFKQQYLLAKEMHADALADQILEIADNTGAEAMDSFIDDDTDYEKPNHEWINRSKLRVDARKWLLSKIMPKKYGEKVEISGNADAPLRHTHQLEQMDDKDLDELIQGFTKGGKGK